MHSPSYLKGILLDEEFQIGNIYFSELCKSFECVLDAIIYITKSASSWIIALVKIISIILVLFKDFLFHFHQFTLMYLDFFFFNPTENS